MKWQNEVLLRLFCSTVALAATVHGAMTLTDSPIAAFACGGCAFLLTDMAVTDAIGALEERR